MYRFKEFLKEFGPTLIGLVALSVIVIFSLRAGAVQETVVPEDKPILECIDGDTFAIEDKFYRLAYIDTPEKRDKGYEEASQYTCQELNKLFHSGRLNIVKHPEIKEKYGRIISEVVYDDGHTLNEDLIKYGLAYPYYPETTDEIVNLFYIAHD